MFRNKISIVDKGNNLHSLSIWFFFYIFSEIPRRVLDSYLLSPDSYSSYLSFNMHGRRILAGIFWVAKECCRYIHRGKSSSFLFSVNNVVWIAIRHWHFLCFYVLHRRWAGVWGHCWRMHFRLLFLLFHERALWCRYKIGGLSFSNLFWCVKFDLYFTRDKMLLDSVMQNHD